MTNKDKTINQKQACSIVGDLLPLYLEGMVSEDTAAFIEQHLAECASCQGTMNQMRATMPIEQSIAEQAQHHEETLQPFYTVQKQLKRKSRSTVLGTVCVVLALLTALHYFPVYHIAQVWWPSYYATGEISMLAYIGSVDDRALAQPVMRLAEEAFSDLHSTEAEQKEKYGLLSRYAFGASRNAASETHSLKLWSAHFDGAYGYMWVYYSQEALDANGHTVSGSWRIPALWYLEKNEDGAWVVTHIKEHP